MEVDMVAEMDVDMVANMEVEFFQDEAFASPNFFKPNLNYPGLRIFLALQVCSKCPHFLCYCLPAEVGAAGFV